MDGNEFMSTYLILWLLFSYQHFLQSIILPIIINRSTTRENIFTFLYYNCELILYVWNWECHKWIDLLGNIQVSHRLPQYLKCSLYICWCIGKWFLMLKTARAVWKIEFEWDMLMEKKKKGFKWRAISERPNSTPKASSIFLFVKYH